MYKFKSISKLLLIGMLAVPAFAAKPAVNTYHTASENAFPEAMRVLAQEGFVLKFTNKDQGMIQAERMAWGSGTAACSALVTVSKDGSIVATFTKSPGVIGHSADKWAKSFGIDLKSSLPDLEVVQQ